MIKTHKVLPFAVTSAVVALVVSIGVSSASIGRAYLEQKRQTTQFEARLKESDARDRAQMKKMCDTVFRYEAYHGDLPGLRKACDPYRTLP